MKAWNQLHTQLQRWLNSDKAVRSDLANLLLRLEIQLIGLDYDPSQADDSSVELCLKLILKELPIKLFPERELRILNRSARWCEKQGLNSLAQTLYQKLVSFSEETGNIELHIQSLQELGDFIRKTGDFVRAEDFQKKAAVIAQKNELHNMHAHSLNNQAVIAIEIGELDKAVKAFENAIQLLEKCPEPLLMGHILNNLGVIYCIQGKPDLAIVELSRSMIFRSEARDQRGIAETCHNLGMASLDLNNLEAAEEYLQRALELSRRISDKHIEANVLLSKAELFSKRQDPVIAGAVAITAKKLHQNLGDPLGVADGFRIYAESEFALLRYEASRRAAMSSLKIYKEFCHPHGLAQCFELLSNLEAQMDNVTKAKKWARQSMECWKQLSNEAAVKRLETFLQNHCC